MIKHTARRLGALPVGHTMAYSICNVDGDVMITGHVMVSRCTENSWRVAGTVCSSLRRAVEAVEAIEAQM